VLVFDGATLVQRGHHDELVAVGGVYGGLHESWTRGVTSAP
jgi:ABC-type multidrug transport system fused ATPase/permease subunit